MTKWQPFILRVTSCLRHDVAQYRVDGCKDTHGKLFGSLRLRGKSWQMQSDFKTMNKISIQDSTNIFDEQFVICARGIDKDLWVQQQLIGI